MAQQNKTYDTLVVTNEQFKSMRKADLKGKIIYVDSEEEKSVWVDGIKYADNGTVRCTQEAYDTMRINGKLNYSRWYVVINKYGQIQRMYMGVTLIAKANEQGSMVFPLTFPFTF